VKGFLAAVRGLGTGFAVYAATLAGIFIAQFAPQLVSSGGISLKAYGWVRLGISALIAFYLVVGQEEGGDQAGKDAHLKRRVANALSHGIAYNAVIGIAQQAVGAQ